MASGVEEEVDLSAISAKDKDEQIVKLQTDIKEQKEALKNQTEQGAVREGLKETLQNNEKMLAELLKDKDVDENASVRHSERAPKPTEKMLAYNREEQRKRENKLASLYERWKCEARMTRQNLKSDLTDKQLSTLADEVDKMQIQVLQMFDEIRARGVPDMELRRKVDACVAVNRDIMRIINERLTGIDGDYDAEREGKRLRELLRPEYARSVYGSVSDISKVSSHHSRDSVAAKRAEAAAEVAAREVEYMALMEEKKQMRFC